MLPVATVEEPAILTIRTGDMHEDGHRFFQAANGVWLTAAVPTRYLKLS